MYVLQVLERIKYLWEALLLFYYSWIPTADRYLYESDVQLIIKSKALSKTEVDRIVHLQTELKRKPLTKEGRVRKERIVQKLFIEQKKTLLQCAAYQSVLLYFEKYITLFQSNNVLLHELHVQLFELTKHFLVLFMKHEVVSGCKTSKAFLKVDIDDSGNHLPEKLLYIGDEGVQIVNKLTKGDATVREFRTVLKKAYIACSKYMLKKLPLNKPLFIYFTGLNPSLRGQTSTFSALMKLSNCLPTVVSASEKVRLDKEARSYQIDGRIEEFQGLEVSEYWAKISQLESSGIICYPVLGKMVKAILTCFHGPSVESAFNLVGDIVTESRTSLNIESLDSVLTVKYFLFSVNSTCIEAFGSNEPDKDPLTKDFSQNMINSWTFYKNSLEKGFNSKKAA